MEATADNFTSQPLIATRPKPTFGEEAFGYVKYLLVGFLANLGIGYLLGRDEVLRHRPDETDKKPLLPKQFHEMNMKIEQWLTHPLHWLLGKLPADMRPGIEAKNNIAGDNIAITQKASKVLSNAILLSWGGIVVSVAMHKLEKNKLPVIRKFDQWNDSLRHTLGGRAPTAEILKGREVNYAYVAEETKKSKDSLGLILTTRGLAMGATVATTLGAILVDPKREGLGRVENWLMRNIDEAENKLIEKKILKKHILGDGDPNTISVNEELFSLGFMECIVGGYTSLADYWRNKHTHPTPKPGHASSLPTQHSVVKLSDFRPKATAAEPENYRQSVNLSREPIAANAIGGF